jgi:hypothetical protein
MLDKSSHADTPRGGAWPEGLGVAAGYGYPATAGPPRGLVLSATGLGVAGLAVLPLRHIALHVVAYVMCSFAIAGLLSAYLRIDASRRQRGLYLPDRLAGCLYRAAAVLAVVAPAPHAYAIATRLAS